MKNPLIIGITGGIGSGKSTLSGLLRSEGYLVYDSDMRARVLQNENAVIRQQLTELFGENIYTSQGLDRVALAKIVFDKPKLLSKLNTIVHPMVKEDLKAWIEKNKKESLLFMESAILFESGFNTLVDKIILITASQQVRIARVVKRDGVSPEQVFARIKNQLTDQEKISRVHFVIHSDDNKALLEKTRKIIEELLTVHR